MINCLLKVCVCYLFGKSAFLLLDFSSALFVFKIRRCHFSCKVSTFGSFTIIYYYTASKNFSYNSSLPKNLLQWKYFKKPLYNYSKQSLTMLHKGSTAIVHRLRTVALSYKRRGSLSICAPTSVHRLRM